MKSLVVYYSFSGKTKKAAQEYAAAIGADLLELTEQKKSNILTAFLIGCPNAVKGRPAKLNSFPYAWEEYDELVFAMPIWASYPAPAFNNCIAVLPKGKQVTLLMVSGGGNSEKSKAHSCELVESRGCTVKDYRDIKGT